MYIVKSGDTYFKIAEKKYGNGEQWGLIRDANPGIDSYNLQSGQQLKIQYKQYTVQSGDTIAKLAEKYLGDSNLGLQIEDANPGIDPNYLQPGQQLQICDPAPSGTTVR